ncbi:MAG: DUF2341 domain-containing protein, partial [Kiritimatiellae bacterium]|nr:DUF2341 domain-containing protein [Kiritimatiellia bacterium]
MPAARSQRIVCLLVSILSSLAISLNASDWPCWHGQNRDGHTDEKITKWPTNELWRANIGQGFSQVVVSQGKVYTAGWSNNQITVRCFDEAVTGPNPTPQWTTSYGCGAMRSDYLGLYSTPTVTGGCVYTYDNLGRISCFDAATGNIVWSNTAFMSGGNDYSGSPLIEGNLLIVNAGGDNGLAAISLTTHNVVWGAPGTHGARYTTPVAATVGGQRVVLGYGHKPPASGFVTGMDLAGNLLFWSSDVAAGAVNGAGIANPVVVDSGRMFVSQGYNTGCALFTLGTTGQLARAWGNSALCTKENTGAIYSNCVYGITDGLDGGGSLRCLDLSNGSVKWSQSGFGIESAVLSAGDQLVIMTGGDLGNIGANGNLVVVQATSTAYTELYRANGILSGYTWTQPMVCNGKLYLRGLNGTMICYEVGTPQPSAGGSGYRMPIQFSGYSPAAPEALTNFPALVVLSNNVNNSAFDFQQMVSPSDGADLRFYSDDTVTELNYEIDTWNPNGSSYLWVQVPTLADSNSFIWAYWGDPNNSTKPAYTTNGGAWDSTFGGV